jgi:hypothetical protein
MSTVWSFLAAKPAAVAFFFVLALASRAKAFASLTPSFSQILHPPLSWLKCFDEEAAFAWQIKHS